MLISPDQFKNQIQLKSIKDRNSTSKSVLSSNLILKTFDYITGRIVRISQLNLPRISYENLFLLKAGRSQLRQIEIIKKSSLRRYTFNTRIFTDRGITYVIQP